MSSEFPYEGGAGINWGEWTLLSTGQWHRLWFEENRDEDPTVPRQPPPMSDLSARFSNLNTNTSTNAYYLNEYQPQGTNIAPNSLGPATAQQRVQDSRTSHRHQKASQADHKPKGKAKWVDPPEYYRTSDHGHDKSKSSRSFRGEEATSSRSHASKGKPSRSSRSDAKGKGKEIYQQPEIIPSGNYGSGDVRDSRDQLRSTTGGNPDLVPPREKRATVAVEGTESLGLKHVADSPIVSSPAYSMTPVAPGSSNTDNFDDDDPPELQAALNQMPALYRSGLPGEGSSRNTIGQEWSSYGPAGEHDDQLADLPSLQSYNTGSRHSRSYSMDDDSPYDEDLSKYIVEKSKKFKFGTVFKVMWSEPMGHTRLSRHNKDPVGSGTSISEFGQRTSSNDVLLYEGIRRFIVVDGVENDARNGNSICIPIATYKKKACTKPGIKAVQHGIIYTSAQASMPLMGEPELGVAPIRLILNKGLEGIEKLAPQSRVNYSKHVTIEHNSLVYFIGKVHSNDLEILERGVDSRWENRIRDRKRHQRHR
ncbi:hypothetical protein KJ359_012202 [Pestalotiopsis sp. 9143b]|nr:hypothetical protein KJ359_012202 [Pestalotiopsis sp. 9143b]